MIEKIKLHTALSHEALYNKSKLYIARGFIARDNKKSDEYQLWASLALELLAKSSLSNYHPSLIADPNHTDSLFAACCVKFTDDIKTITAKTLFNRLSHISKKFDIRVSKYCEQLSLDRNSEIHSGAAPFSGKNSSWELRYWYAVKLILHLQDKDLDDLLDNKYAKEIKDLINSRREFLIEFIGEDIKSSKKRFNEKYPKSEHKKQAIKDSSSIQPNTYLHKIKKSEEYKLSEPCPSCSSYYILGGTLWDEDVKDGNIEDYMSEYESVLYIE